MIVFLNAYDSMYLGTSRTKFILRIFAGFFILYLLFTNIPFDDVKNVLIEASLGYFIISVLVALLSVGIMTLRWQYLLSYLGYEYKVFLLLKLSLMAFFFNHMLPGGIAGEVVRIMAIPNKDHRKKKSEHIFQITASVLTDRITGMLGVMILSIFGFVFHYELLVDMNLLFIFLTLIASGISLFFMLFSKRIQIVCFKLLNLPIKYFTLMEKVYRQITDALFVYRKHYHVLYITTTLSVLANVCVVLYFYLLAVSIGMDIEFLIMLALVPIIEFISTLPISFGGVGIREFACILLFASIGIDSTMAMSLSLLSFVILLILGGIGSMFYIISKYNTH